MRRAERKEGERGKKGASECDWKREREHVMCLELGKAMSDWKNN